MYLSLLLFIIGVLGFVLNRRNLILMLISIEIMLLAITYLILVSSVSFDDILGQTYAIYIISIAGAESAIGLGIFVAFYRLRGTVVIDESTESSISSSYSSSFNPSSVSSKEIGVRRFSTLHTKFDPWFVTGLLDAEGSLVVSILKNSTVNTGWRVQRRMQIKLHETDRALLESVQSFFGGSPPRGGGYPFGIGYIAKPDKNSVEFWVSTINDIISFIIPRGVEDPPSHAPGGGETHLDKTKGAKPPKTWAGSALVSLITQKKADYELFKQIVFFMDDKEHLNLDGLQRILNTRASMNLGLSAALKEAAAARRAAKASPPPRGGDAFPGVIPVSRSKVEGSPPPSGGGYLGAFGPFGSLGDNTSPEWLAGFSTGESCFFITTQNSKTKSGISVSPRFSIAQHSRDTELMSSMVKYFGCGYVADSKRLISEFIVTRIEDILEKIIPFFDAHPAPPVGGSAPPGGIRGSKSQNYQDFKKAVNEAAGGGQVHFRGGAPAVNLIKNKEHLTEEGLKQVLEIKSGMNTGRLVHPSNKNRLSVTVEIENID